MHSFEIDREDLPDGDYVAPGLVVVRPDACFPHMHKGNVADNDWRYLRREIPHAWYVDERKPTMGFIGRDEAVLLHNLSRGFAGKRALEVGAWFGWSTAHLALGGVLLDVVDPILADPLHRASIEQSLTCCGVRAQVTLHAEPSPGALAAIAAANAEAWSLLFIDGDHEGLAAARDVEAALPFVARDAALIFHDLASPHVAEALALLESRGFNVMIYQTMQVMGVAWRGQVTPVHHAPDPAIPWQVPHHLLGYPVSGVAQAGHSVAFRENAVAMSNRIAELEGNMAQLQSRLLAGAAERADLAWQVEQHLGHIGVLQRQRGVVARLRSRLRGVLDRS